ncbi:MAG TPA: ATP-binding protein [Pseudolabrys sp.]|nr:ATP-binding protein [Pseudolabrys sp.]
MPATGRPDTGLIRMQTTRRTSGIRKALIAWSSGKDSAWALHECRNVREFEIVGALTTITEDFNRVSMHGVREELVRAQLDAARLRPIVVRIPFPCPNEIYEQKMAAAVSAARSSGITHMVFGDLFLEDVRKYREQRFAGTGIMPVFPLWGRPTPALAREMIEAGVEAHLCTVDLKKLPASYAGRRFDGAMLESLPPGIDPCGENGEFHTFVSAGPMFSKRIAVRPAETVQRDGFAFADFLSV